VQDSGNGGGQGFQATQDGVTAGGELLAGPDDLPFAEVFITANAQALVTGNLRHFSPLIEKGLAVYSPAQFLERFFP
jgi:hypothetical protein